MRHFRTILIIGIIEILTGIITLFTTLWTVALSSSKMSLNALVFVIVTGVISTLIGTGILTFKKQAYQALLYFSSVIVLTKILIFAGIFHLNSALEAFVPLSIKNIISVVYHSSVIYYLKKDEIRRIFHI